MKKCRLSYLSLIIQSLMDSKDAPASSSLVGLDAYRRDRLDTIRTGRRAEWCRLAGSRLSRVILASHQQGSKVNGRGEELLMEAIGELVFDTDHSSGDDEMILREAMSDFLEIFVHLVRRAEVPEPSIRRLAHRLFDDLLSNFEPVAQFLLLCRLVELVSARTVVVEMEPQILAWLIDQYRKRLSSNDDKNRVFRDEISRLYGQIQRLTYADMVVAHPFYVAVLLLVREHATHRFGLPLLRAMRVAICERVETQLADYLQMRELQTRSRRPPSVDVDEENQTTKAEDPGPDHADQSMFVLELIMFRLADTATAVKKALDSV